MRKYKGKVLVDIREFYEKDDKLLPSKKGKSFLHLIKGISLSEDLWIKIKELAPKIDKALITMKKD